MALFWWDAEGLWWCAFDMGVQYRCIGSRKWEGFGPRSHGLRKGSAMIVSVAGHGSWLGSSFVCYLEEKVLMAWNAPLLVTWRPTVTFNKKSIYGQYVDSCCQAKRWDPSAPVGWEGQVERVQVFSKPWGAVFVAEILSIKHWISVTSLWHVRRWDLACQRFNKPVETLEAGSPGSNHCAFQCTIRFCTSCLFPRFQKYSVL